MGQFLTDKAFINENIFQFEKRLESQYTIFLDKSPTFATYYHINNINSAVDNGFQNVEDILGPDSPIRFQRVEDFPIYGIESIKLDLQDEEEGLTTTFEGEGIILPNTLKPLPNDFFTISYLNNDYLFMVISIDYDTIKSNNFYRITFQLRSTNPDSRETIESQVLEKYKCIFDNIGTDDKCLLKEDEIEKYIQLNAIYSAFIEKYRILFYSKKFNSFLFNKENNDFLYDKYLTHFIDSNNLFNEPHSYQTLTLSNEDYNERFIIEYDYSFYTAIEHRDISEVDYSRILTPSVSYMNSIFKYYHVSKMKSVMFIDNGIGGYISDTLIDNIQANVTNEVTPILEELIIKYFNDDIESIYNIKIDELKKYKIRYDYDDFILIPIILYILRFYADKFITL